MPEMTRVQRKLAKYIMENKKEVVFLTTAELGKKAGVSEATVIRFARFLGFSGYSDLKKNLQQIIKEKITPEIKMKETVERIQNKTDVFKNLLNIDMAMLEKVGRNCTEKDIDQAVNYLKNAGRVFLIGMGVSRSIVYFLEFRLNRLGYSVIPVTTGGNEVIDKMNLIKKGDVAIGIGFFRPHRELITALDIAKNKGVPIISLTDSNTSPLGSYGSVVLKAKRGPADIMTSLAAPMSLANILILSLAMEVKNRALNSFSELERLKEKYNL